MDKTPLLSVILVARNEAQYIAMAIESVLFATRNWSSTEILLVDSASTDRTVEIALQYPINIIRIKPSNFLSAGAGRYIGQLYTEGRLIMFMDGDMTMATDWLDIAIPFLMSHPDLAGVTGQRRDVYVADGHISEEGVDVFSEEYPVEVLHFGGAALYRRTALEKVGGFNPYLISEEEPELCMRLRYSGYKLFRIPNLVCINHTLPISSWQYFSHRFRANLWLGHGQVIRYHIRTGMFWIVIRERGTFVFFLPVMLFCFIAFSGAILSKNTFLISVCVAMVLIAFLVLWIKKRSIQKILLSFIHQCWATYGGIRGFLIPTTPAGQYPTDVEIVRVQGAVR